MAAKAPTNGEIEIRKAKVLTSLIGASLLPNEVANGKPYPPWLKLRRKRFAKGALSKL
jgi:hypothetical protein